MIYLFAVPSMSLVSSFGKSSSYITHLDWSLDSNVLRTNDGSYELLYYDVKEGKQDTSGATAYRDEKWDSHTCVISWATQGCWQSGMNGTDINQCDRSNKPVKGQQLIATADDSGFVNVFRYPCINRKSVPLTGKGHSSHVTKVNFTQGDNYIISTGGGDTSVIQWKITDKKNPEPKIFEQPVDNGEVIETNEQMEPDYEKFSRLNQGIKKRFDDATVKINNRPKTGRNP